MDPDTVSILFVVLRRGERSEWHISHIIRFEDGCALPVLECQIKAAITGVLWWFGGFCCVCYALDTLVMSGKSDSKTSRLSHSEGSRGITGPRFN